MSEIFILEKYIKYNKIKNNKYATIRDEVLVKSYQILRSQNKMARDILDYIDKYHIEKFITKMGEQFIINQKEVQRIMDIDYKPILLKKDNNKNLKEAQKNIRDYYAIIAINLNTLNYFANNANRIYRLNKYEKYGILEIALFLDNSEMGKKINPILNPYNLSIIKIPLMLFISLFIYLIRTRLYRLTELLLLKVKLFEKYSQEIMATIRKPINYLLVMINIELIFYIYHNFNSIDTINKFSNIIYALLFTIIIYRILNTVAAIHITDIEQSNRVIKSEMVNVSIKIINFIIFIMGILLVLHFAGANLATVLSGLGIGGFAIALAARESLSNFLGTISILMSDTFSQGDWIVVDDKEGTVVEIGLRVTTLRTFDNALISIPNGNIANREVKNWNKRTLGRRIKFSVGIKYHSKSTDIRNAIEEIREMLRVHPDIATDKTNYHYDHPSKRSKLVSKEDSLGVKRTLFVYLDEFSDSSINILIYCFTKKTAWGSWLDTKEDVMYKIMDILEKNSCPLIQKL